MNVSDTLSVEQFLSHLQSVRKVGDNWQAQCPAHEDRRASLSIKEGTDGRILVNCHAGCTFEAIIGAVGLSAQSFFPPAERHFEPERRSDSQSRGPGGKIVKTYDYHDLNGVLRYQVCRFEPKDFRQRQPDPNKAGAWLWNMKGVVRVPYRLNELIDEATVFIVEGEKDADALWQLGIPATTNVMGAGKWKELDAEGLKAAGCTRAVILPDNDSVGRKHADTVARGLRAIGIGATIISLEGIPPKGDVSDWLAAGHTRKELDAEVARAIWTDGDGSPAGKETCDESEHPLRWKQSDVGASEAFAYRYRDHVRYDHQKDQWLVWAGHYWKPDATREVCRLAIHHARLWQQETSKFVDDYQDRIKLLAFTMKLERRNGVENLLHLAHAMLPIADSGENWNVNPYLLGCPNGVVNLKTGERHDGYADERITLQTRVPYVPDAACPRWMKFLNEIFLADQEVITYVQRALGYSLTGNIREQCFFMCVGGGSNGKSTFLSTLDHIWGQYCYTTDMRTFTNSPGAADSMEFNMAELMSRRLILASETKSNSSFNETAIKNFTGGEKVNAQRKYGHPFEFLPTGKIWLGVNHQPRVRDDSLGFWRRVRLIPFNATFRGSAEDRNLKETLQAEGPGILAWAVRGALEWNDVGLQPPNSIMTATDAYQESEDPLHDFILERVIIEEGQSVSGAVAYAGYKEWAKDQGLSEREMLTSTTFGRLLSRRFEKLHTDKGKRYQNITVISKARNLLD